MPLPFAIIIEPNDSLNVPYSYLEDICTYERCSSIESGLRLMSQKYPDLVFLSASFSLAKSVQILDALKNKSATTLVPIIIVVDFSSRASNVPGTTWGNKIGIVSSLSSVNELNSTLDRVMNT